jgi:hypothetical protein
MSSMLRLTYQCRSACGARRLGELSPGELVRALPSIFSRDSAHLAYGIQIRSDVISPFAPGIWRP